MTRKPNRMQVTETKMQASHEVACEICGRSADCYCDAPSMHSGGAAPGWVDYRCQPSCSAVERREKYGDMIVVSRGGLAMGVVSCLLLAVAVVMTQNGMTGVPVGVVFLAACALPLWWTTIR
jgi:hypothetical protein